jgi:hypothetical protein
LHTIDCGVFFFVRPTLYGIEDQRVNATIPAADSAMKALGKVYEPHIFPGAGHGFLRQQDLPRVSSLGIALT